MLRAMEGRGEEGGDHASYCAGCCVRLDGKYSYGTLGESSLIRLPDRHRSVADNTVLMATFAA